jgi:fructokinase
VLLSRTGERIDRPGTPIEVADTVGAGDAVTTALALGLAHRMPLTRLNAWAARVAEYVRTRPGGAPDFPAP